MPPPAASWSRPTISRASAPAPTAAAGKGSRCWWPRRTPGCVPCACATRACPSTCWARAWARPSSPSPSPSPTAPPIDGVILSAPAVWGGDALSPLYRRALTIAGLVAPWAKLTGGGLGIQASDNIPALIELGQDPLYIRETRIDAIVGLVEAMDQARDRAPLLAIPTLVLTGARDEVVPPQSQAEFIGFLPAERCAAVTYLDGSHLLLRDLQRERVFADIVAWAEGLRLPSGLDRPCGVAPDA